MRPRDREQRGLHRRGRWRPCCPAAWKRRDDGSAYLSNIAVDPAFRRRGIARTATLFLLEEAKGCTRIDLLTHPDNAAAIALYRSLGFAVESRREDYFGDGEPRAVMLKSDRSVVCGLRLLDLALPNDCSWRIAYIPEGLFNRFA